MEIDNLHLLKLEEADEALQALERDLQIDTDEAKPMKSLVSADGPEGADSEGANPGANPEAKKVYQDFNDYARGLCSLKRSASKEGAYALEDTLRDEGTPKKLRRTLSSADLSLLASSLDSNSQSDAHPRSTQGTLGDSDADLMGTDSD